MMFLDCPAYLDQEGTVTVRAARRGQVPLHHALNRRAGRKRHDQVPGRPLLLRGHLIPHLGRQRTGTTRTLPGPGSRAGRDSLQRGPDGRHWGGGSAHWDVPPGRNRQPAAPSFEQSLPPTTWGRPADLWITAMHPRRRRTASRHLMGSRRNGGNPTPHSGMPPHR